MEVNNLQGCRLHYCTGSTSGLRLAFKLLNNDDLVFKKLFHMSFIGCRSDGLILRRLIDRSLINYHI